MFFFSGLQPKFCEVSVIKDVAHNYIHVCLFNKKNTLL